MAMARDFFEWTDEAVVKLRRLWCEGYSASRIADALGPSCTRNAVIGKVHRLKFARRDADTRDGLTAPAKILPFKGVQRPHASKPKKIAAPKPSLARAAQPPRVASSPVIPMSERVGIADLNTKTCRWPMGDPQSPSFRFCGAVEADLDARRPYCPYHERIAWGPGTGAEKRATKLPIGVSA